MVSTGDESVRGCSKTARFLLLSTYCTPLDRTQDNGSERSLKPSLHIHMWRGRGKTINMQRIWWLEVSQNDLAGRHGLPAARLECRFRRLALMRNSMWFMESRAAIRTPQLVVSTVLEISGKHFTEDMMWHSWRREQSTDGWNTFILDALLPQSRKPNRITQYVRMLNFLSGNKPLKIHTGDSLDLHNPHLHRWENIFMLPICYCLKVKSPHETAICSLTWQKEHKCLRQVTIPEQSRSQTFKTADTAKNDHWDVYDPSPQAAILWPLQAMRRRAIWDSCHEGQPTKSASDLSWGFKSPAIHTEIEMVHQVECFKTFHNVLLCTGMLACMHIFHWQAVFLRAVD